MKTEGSNLLLLTISAFWSSSRWPSRRQRGIALCCRYRQVSLYKVHNSTQLQNGVCHIMQTSRCLSNDITKHCNLHPVNSLNICFFVLLIRTVNCSNRWHILEGTFYDYTQCVYVCQLWDCHGLFTRRTILSKNMHVSSITSAMTSVSFISLCASGFIPCGW